VRARRVPPADARSRRAVLRWKGPRRESARFWYRALGYKVRAGGPASSRASTSSPTCRRDRRRHARCCRAPQPDGDDRQPRLSGRLLVLHRAEDGGQGVHAAARLPGAAGALRQQPCRRCRRIIRITSSPATRPPACRCSTPTAALSRAPSTRTSTRAGARSIAGRGASPTTTWASGRRRARHAKMLKGVSPEDEARLCADRQRAVRAVHGADPEVIAWGGEPHVQPIMKLNALPSRTLIATASARRGIVRRRKASPAPSSPSPPQRGPPLNGTTWPGMSS
jgi:hypothetical protein